MCYTICCESESESEEEFEEELPEEDDKEWIPDQPMDPAFEDHEEGVVPLIGLVHYKFDVVEIVEKFVPLLPARRSHSPDQVPEDFQWVPEEKPDWEVMAAIDEEEIEREIVYVERECQPCMPCMPCQPCMPMCNPCMPMMGYQ